MPLNEASASTPSCQEFCLALKAARESKGITLAEIAESTKIPAYLMEGLERCDLRRWPKGLFRRSFFRDYARMIGVSVTDAAAEFVRLFPDDTVEQPSKVESAAIAAGQSGAISGFAASLKRVTEALSRMFQSAGTESTEEPQTRAWVSDARRIGPAPPSKLRVRIKVPR